MVNPDLPKYDWLVEEDTLIPNEQKRERKILSSGGQNLQASIDDDLRLFFKSIIDGYKYLNCVKIELSVISLHVDIEIKIATSHHSFHW